MSTKILIVPAELGSAATAYRSASTALGEVSVRLAGPAPDLPYDLACDVRAALDHGVRDLREQMSYAAAEATALERRAWWVKMAGSSAEVAAAFDALGIAPNVAALSESAYPCIPLITVSADRTPTCANGERPPQAPDAVLSPQASVAATPRSDTGNLSIDLVDTSFGTWARVARGHDCRVRGGGLLRGPDGHLYAIVTDDADDRTFIRPADRPGIDVALPGTVATGPTGIVYGVGPEIPESATYALSLLGATGANLPYGQPIPVIDRDGNVTLVDARTAPPAEPVTATPPGWHPPASLVGELSPSARSRLMRSGQVGVGVLPLINGAVAGYMAGEAMENRRAWSYGVEYYEVEGGGRRARLHLSQTHYDADGRVYVTHALGSFDAAGNIVVGPYATMPA